MHDLQLDVEKLNDQKVGERQREKNGIVGCYQEEVNNNIMIINTLEQTINYYYHDVELAKDNEREDSMKIATDQEDALHKKTKSIRRRT